MLGREHSRTKVLTVGGADSDSATQRENKREIVWMYQHQAIVPIVYYCSLMDPEQPRICE